LLGVHGLNSLAKLQFAITAKFILHVAISSPINLSGQRMARDSLKEESAIRENGFFMVELENN
jgi:hypothetical protein